MRLRKNRFTPFLIGMLLILCALSYAPAFSAHTTGVVGGTLNKYIYALTILLLIITFRFKEIISCPFFVGYFRYFILILMMGLLLLAFGLGKGYLDEVKDVGLPLCVTIIAFNTKFTNHQLQVIAILYSIVLLSVTAILILTYIGSFSIVDQYLIASKNGLGGMLLVSFIACIGLSFSGDIHKRTKSLLIIIAALSFFCCLTMRARGATLFMFVECIILLLRIRRENPRLFSKLRIILSMVIPLLVVILAVTNSFPGIIDYIEGAFGLAQEGDITNGRTDRNAHALSVFSDSPLFGLLALPYKIEWVHNYLLLKLSSYGLIGGVPLFFLYFYLLFFAIRNLKKNGFDMEYKLGYWALVSLFFLSLLEPTPPYTPGTTVVFAYVLLGYSIRKNSEV